MQSALQLCSYMRDACTGHALPYSCVRTCVMHVQATLCTALQLCSYMRDACTGHALPYSCVRTCAVHVRATLCLSTVLAYARHARSALCPADARRVLHTHGISACARKRARGSGTDRLLPWLARSVPCCLHASIPQLATPNCGRSQTRVDLGM